MYALATARKGVHGEETIDLERRDGLLQVARPAEDMFLSSAWDARYHYASNVLLS